MIQAKEASIKLVHSGVITAFFSAFPNKGNAPLNLYAEPVLFDFDISETNKGSHQIFLNIANNIKEKPQPGYSFDLTFFGEFTLDETDEGAGKRLVLFSALPMLINQARTFLITMSAQSMHGSYILPMIDVKQLVADKVEQEKKAPAKKKKALPKA